MRRIAMGAMALAGLSAFAQADHAKVDECLNTITADKEYFSAEAGYVTTDRSIDGLTCSLGGAHEAG